MRTIKAKRKPAEVPDEAAVYDGRRLVGVIERAPGAFAARDAAGERIGVFSTEKLAMNAILAGARLAAEAETR